MAEALCVQGRVQAPEARSLCDVRGWGMSLVTGAGGGEGRYLRCESGGSCRRL